MWHHRNQLLDKTEVWLVECDATLLHDQGAL